MHVFLEGRNLPKVVENKVVFGIFLAGVEFNRYFLERRESVIRTFNYTFDLNNNWSNY